MCSVVGAVSAIATLASTAVGVYAQSESQRVQERATRQAAQYNAEVAANEAAMREQLARNEIAKGVAERSQQQRKAARAMGGMRAAMGASGFTLDSGSNLSLLAESAVEHQYDSSVITSNAAQAAWQHQVGAANAKNDHNFALYQGNNADSGRGASMLGMGSTIIGGIADGIGQYNQWNKTKPAKTGNRPAFNMFSDDWGN